MLGKQENMLKSAWLIPQEIHPRSQMVECIGHFIDLRNPTQVYYSDCYHTRVTVEAALIHMAPNCIPSLNIEAVHHSTRQLLGNQDIVRPPASLRSQAAPTPPTQGTRSTLQSRSFTSSCQPWNLLLSPLCHSHYPDLRRDSVCQCRSPSCTETCLT